jgi:(R,R)-butanediol dehydrogenase / meso-butanediol dehydrogenase / diacetyl reductase
MKAGVYREPGLLEYVDIPDPVLEAGDVLVEVAGCGICGSDLESLRHGSNVSAGQVMGHEIGGRVLDAGGVDGLAAGDLVALRPLLACGGCASCLRGQTQLCERSVSQGLGYGLPGGFAERVRVPAAALRTNIFLLPAATDPTLGALVEPLAVSLRGVKQAEAGDGDTVLVLGLGQIGLGAVVLAQLLGASLVIGVDPSPMRREAALRMGAAVVVDPLVTKVEHAVRELTGPGPYSLGAAADCAVECSGVPSSFAAAVKALRPGGRLSLVAHSREPFAVKSGRIIEKELRVQGSFAYRDEMQEVTDLVADGRLDLAAFVSHRVPLAEVDRAFAVQGDAGGSLKVLVQP